MSYFLGNSIRILIRVLLFLVAATMNVTMTFSIISDLKFVLLSLAGIQDLDPAVTET